jgi:hypothetical protein
MSRKPKSVNPYCLDCIARRLAPRERRNFTWEQWRDLARANGGTACDGRCGGK